MPEEECANPQLPRWMLLLHDCLDSHLKTFGSPVLEILPHPEDADPRRCSTTTECGSHEAFKTHRQHFCLFLCCAKSVSRRCMEVVGTSNVKEDDDDGEESLIEIGKSSLSSSSSSSSSSSVDDSSSRHRQRRVCLARLCLLATPEDYRAWNVLKDPSLDPKGELKFAYFLLSKHSRSAETFCHLRHLIRRLWRELDDETEGQGDRFYIKTRLCEEGFAKCAEAASRYHGNYHAWDHRRFLVNLLLGSGGGGSGGCGDIAIDAPTTAATTSALLQKELDDVEAWQRSRVSDACPFKYRLSLVESCAEAGGCVRFDFAEELADLNRLMTTFVGHETLWNYRRDLMKLAANYGSAAESKNGKREVDFQLLLRDDAKFLASLEGKSKTDWEMMLHERYSRFCQTLRYIRVDKT